jgi:hypothetical protein
VDTRGVNGMDNFHFESAFVSVFENIVFTFKNLPDIDADVDIDQEDI